MQNEILEIASFLTRTGIFIIFCQIGDEYAISSFYNEENDLVTYNGFGEALMEFNELCQ